MGISLGCQLIAPDGFLNLRNDETYYFLRSGECGVLLVVFELGEPRLVEHNSVTRPTKTVVPEPKAVLVQMERDSFEAGVESSLITPREVQRTLPPWLDALEGLDLAQSDSFRREKRKDHQKRIDERLEVIWPLVQMAQELLSSPRPDKAINAFVRKSAPNKNQVRVCLWFLTYLVFGRNRFALHYPIHRPGSYDHSRIERKKKMGRPSSLGKEFGHNVTPEMADKIRTGFLRCTDLGKSHYEIYVDVMRVEFGCRARKVLRKKEKVEEIFQPHGRPFPQFGAYLYHVKKLFGRGHVRASLIGGKREREEYEPFRGAFTERTINLMARVEDDAYTVSEHPKGLLDDTPLPKLKAGSKRDTTSGALTGVGFGLGAETGTLYRMAAFCEAVDKVWFCSLFGLEITADEWPMIGTMSGSERDRGPGAHQDGKGRIADLEPATIGLARSYDGQGKATVESSHPRDRKNREQPNYVVSDSSVVGLIRREILRVIQFNKTADVRSRVPPDLANRIGKAVPNNLYALMDSLGRNSAIQMSREDAIRSFLDRRSARITRAGVEVSGLEHANILFDSVALDATDAKRRAAARDIQASVFYLEGCLRHVWLDWSGRLIELDLKFPVPVHSSLLYLSFQELEQLSENARVDDRHALNDRLAVMLDVRHRYVEATGDEWGGGIRRYGRAKLAGKHARARTREMRNALRGDKAA